MLCATALLACVGAGLLAATEGGKVVAEPPARTEKTVPESALTPPIEPAVEPPLLPGDIEIVSPESGARLRGTALIKVDWANPLGHVIFRIDDRFAYATTPPFEMRWDTSTALDGQHLISVDAYNASAQYAGGASIGVIVENSVPTPPEGVLLTVRFGEHDLSARTVSARGELSALRADEVLPSGFGVLEAELRAELSQSVMDPFYEGVSALVRSRLRTAMVTTEGTNQSLPEVGRYVMVQVSRNGLSLPADTASTKPRLGLAEVSLALRDFPVLPGDTWVSPIGVLCDLYSRRAVYVQGRHVFEGLRWFRGRECAVITSTYSIPELPIYEQGAAWSASTRTINASDLKLELTARGGGGRGGRGGRSGRTAGTAGRGGAGTARGGKTTPPRTTRPGTSVSPTDLDSARLVNLEGNRRTYVTRYTGKVIHTEDTILGEVEFRTAAARTALNHAPSYKVKLTAGRGGRGGRGGMSAGRGGAARGGTARAATGTRTAPGRTTAPTRGIIPPRLDYGFRLTTDLIIE